MAEEARRRRVGEAETKAETKAEAGADDAVRDEERRRGHRSRGGRWPAQATEVTDEV